MIRSLLLFGILVLGTHVHAQGPWNNPLRYAWSADGRTFSAPELFQDSAGVVSVATWKGDTLIAVFQWFRAPKTAPTWDRVAAKFSYDNGRTWTEPQPLVFDGLPASYQRPFDPTVVVLSRDSLRLYYSSSNGMPMGSDSLIDTHSAVSTDGVHFVFEPGPRVNVASRKIIDPAVVRFGPGWHLTAPVGAPQEGAYHYLSPDGLRFSPVPVVPSDNVHNWTGNFTVVDSTELRFYGCGREIWYASSPNGGVWSGYVATNLRGGDPSVVRVADSLYLMVFTGEPYLSSVKESCVPSARADCVRGVCTVEHGGLFAGCDVDVVDALGRRAGGAVAGAESVRIELHAPLSGLVFLRFLCAQSGHVIPTIVRE